MKESFKVDFHLINIVMSCKHATGREMLDAMVWEM